MSEIRFEQIIRFVQRVYFALKRRDLLRLRDSLILIRKGRNKGKRSFLLQ